METILHVGLQLLLGTISSLFAIWILWIAARSSKHLREYLFELLGVRDLNRRYREALALLLKQQERLNKLNRKLVGNHPKACSADALRTAITREFEETNDAVAQLQRNQDRFDEILRLKERLLTSISPNAKHSED